MIQLPVSSYSPRELREEIAEAEADIKTIQKAVAVFKSHYLDSSDLKWLVKDLTAGIETNKQYLQVLAN